MRLFGSVYLLRQQMSSWGVIQAIFFIRRKKQQRVLLLPTWEYLNLSLHPRPSETTASQACVAPAPRRVETYSAFLCKERVFCPLCLNSPRHG